MSIGPLEALRDHDPARDESPMCSARASETWTGASYVMPCTQSADSAATFTANRVRAALILPLIRLSCAGVYFLALSSWLTKAQPAFALALVERSYLCFLSAW